MAAAKKATPSSTYTNSPMSNNDTLTRLNDRAPGFIKMLGGQVVDMNSAAGTCTFEFDISTDFCHSIDIVQGGFITTMLDAAMSHAVFGCATDDLVSVSSLEIKTSYLAPTRAGKLTAVGKIVKQSHKTAFLEGQLYNAAGELTATSSSVAKLIRQRAEPQTSSSAELRDQ